MDCKYYIIKSLDNSFITGADVVEVFPKGTARKDFSSFDQRSAVEIKIDNFSANSEVVSEGIYNLSMSKSKGNPSYGITFSSDSSNNFVLGQQIALGFKYESGYVNYNFFTERGIQPLGYYYISEINQNLNERTSDITLTKIGLDCISNPVTYNLSKYSENNAGFKMQVDSSKLPYLLYSVEHIIRDQSTLGKNIIFGDWASVQGGVLINKMDTFIYNKSNLDIENLDTAYNQTPLSSVLSDLKQNAWSKRMFLEYDIVDNHPLIIGDEFQGGTNLPYLRVFVPPANAFLEEGRVFSTYLPFYRQNAIDVPTELPTPRSININASTNGYKNGLMVMHEDLTSDNITEYSTIYGSLNNVYGKSMGFNFDTIKIDKGYENPEDKDAFARAYWLRSQPALTISCVFDVEIPTFEPYDVFEARYLISEKWGLTDIKNFSFLSEEMAEAVAGNSLDYFVEVESVNRVINGFLMEEHVTFSIRTPKIEVTGGVL